MTTANKKPHVSSNDYWEVSHAAGLLTSQACTVSARHIRDGMLRIQFNREVAYYARGIVADVESGRKSAEEGLKEIKGESESLKDQSKRIAAQSIGLVAGGFQIAAGVGICVGSLGWVCIPASAIIGHGINNIYENGNNLLTGRSDTEGWGRIPYQLASEYLGGGKLEANIAYGTVDIGMSLFGAFRHTLKKDAWRLYRYVDTDYVRAYKQSSKTTLGVDAMGGTVTTKGMIDEWRKEE